MNPQSSTTAGAWVGALRLRTLPLALSSISLGSFLAAFENQFKMPVFILSALTTVFLQILSNLANDYGDSVHGADSEIRKGPGRAVQQGLISAGAMKNAIYVLIGLSLVSGISLLYLSVGFNFNVFLFFLSVGILSILAAVSYTAGINPYGYSGLGDIAVMLFFGFVGVMGVFYLHTGFISAGYVLPAATCGFFSVAVLNINNIRDIESDRQAGKKSVPVRLGRKKAITYHWILLGSGWLCALGFTWLNYTSAVQLIFIAVIPLFWRNARAVAVSKDSSMLDPWLKQMALATLLFVLLFGAGLVLAQ
ncbi:MAG: 1,4-dihydroxy-2-naphthoate polyprenyltransferase [Bacteroidetes bacterium]|nr:1,4-dihydroxy-2-naphthoate polyprenyltransferase [Bacteroidota bacterium]